MENYLYIDEIRRTLIFMESSERPISTTTTEGKGKMVRVRVEPGQVKQKAVKEYRCYYL